MKINLLKSFIALTLAFYGGYLCLTAFKVGKLAKSINDFQKKIEFKSCVRVKSEVECREGVYK